MTPCGEGGVCDYTIADPMCIDASADTDGDGIPNSMDHCPNAPGGLYDEDGDGIGDECDRCPIAKPPAAIEPDGDEVDAPCDPDIHTPGDKILLFDGFGDPTLNPRWVPTTASAWQVQGGELVVRLGGQETQDFMTTTVIPEPNLAVQASYRVDKVETSSTTHIVSALAIDKRPAGVSSFECGVVKSDVSTDEIVSLETDQGAVSHGAMVGAFDSARLYRTAARLTGVNVDCTVIGDNMPLAVITNTLSPDSLGTVKLTGRAVTARFQWVLVVGRPNDTGGGPN